MLPLVMYATVMVLVFWTSLWRTPPMEITSSSGWGEKHTIRAPLGSLERPRILAPRTLNTKPFTAPGDP